jgi:hypothetical protein
MSKSRPRYLTKSRYKLALECPTKLFYSGKPEQYLDKSIDDPFLIALARGGFQVGALAQCYFPSGVTVTSLEHENALSETATLLKQENVTIFEAAFLFENLFVRVDILQKVGDQLRVIEVKSKSFDPNEEDQFFDKRMYANGKFKIKEAYSKYIYDVAFQAFVVKNACPGFKVTSRLMMADKSSQTSVDGLNQLFLLRTNAKGRISVEVKPGVTAAKLGSQILCEVGVDEAVNAIHQDKDEGRPATVRCEGLSYADEIRHFAKMYLEDRKITSSPGARCRDCEFRVSSEHSGSQLSGFDECWVKEAKVNPVELTKPFVFDIWNFRKSGKLINAKKYFVKDVCEDDVGPKPNQDEPGLSQSERQWVQVQFEQKGRTAPHIDVDGLKAAMSAWKYPLHFIDFETAMVAVPFSAGCRPYQTLAFQFSHHVLRENGKIEHVGQYLNETVGSFPNFEFVRALKESLSADDGTIFRYAAHENTVLCQIYEQLKMSKEADRAELMGWIQTVTKSGSSSCDTWLGPRNMVDLYEIVKRYYYHPMTKGSVSIKKVFPAMLSDSPELRARFSDPIYGSKSGIKSLNFADWSWIRIEGRGFKDPYELLPNVYRNLSGSQLDAVMCDDELADGGAAMTAYAMMQFTDMSDIERRALREALLKYCELDTFAMVLLVEYWREFVSGKRQPVAA